MRTMTAVLAFATLLCACEKKDAAPAAPVEPASKTAQPAAPAPAPAPPPLDPNNIVSIASGSKDHTTLVAALKAADYVTSVANPGPLTVFAPTDAAFAKLPAGTVEGLLEPAKLNDLRNVLKYHVTAAVYDRAALKDGMTLGMANGGKIAIKVVGDTITINDATIVATIRASNGIVHVIDGVLLPPAPAP